MSSDERRRLVLQAAERRASIENDSNIASARERQKKKIGLDNIHSNVVPSTSTKKFSANKSNYKYTEPNVDIYPPQTSLWTGQSITNPNQNMRSETIGELQQQRRDNSEIIASFTECMTNWYRKIHKMDGDVPPNSMTYQNKMSSASNEIKYYINNLNVIGEDHIKELIKYCKEVIEKISVFKGTIPSYTTRDIQNEIIRDIKHAVSSIKFPNHDNKMIRYVGSDIVFTDFPLKTNVQTNGSISAINPAPPYQNWSSDIPDLIIERINCYINAFMLLLGDVCSDEDRQPNGSCIVSGGRKYKKSSSKRNRKTHKKRTRKNKSRKFRK